jgi:hypothetical protein
MTDRIGEEGRQCLSRFRFYYTQIIQVRCNCLLACKANGSVTLIVPKLKRCSLPEHPFTIMGLRDQSKVMLRKTEHHFILVAVIHASSRQINPVSRCGGRRIGCSCCIHKREGRRWDGRRRRSLVQDSVQFVFWCVGFVRAMRVRSPVIAVDH